MTDARQLAEEIAASRLSFDFFLGASGNSPEHPPVSRERYIGFLMGAIKKASSEDKLSSENTRLRELVRHCWAHKASSNCGADRMTSEQAALYAAIVSAPFGYEITEPTR